MFYDHTQSDSIRNQFGFRSVSRAEEVQSRCVPVYLGWTSTGPKQSQWSLNGYRTSYGVTENVDSADDAFPRFLLTISLWNRPDHLNKRNSASEFCRFYFKEKPSISSWSSLKKLHRRRFCFRWLNRIWRRRNSSWSRLSDLRVVWHIERGHLID